MSLRVAFVQDGSRLHYSVPRALLSQGALHRMYADAGIAKGSLPHRAATLLSHLGFDRATRLMERQIGDIPESLVYSSLALRARVEAWRLALRPTPGTFHRWESRQVGHWIRRTGLGDSNVLHGFIRNLDPELIRWSRDLGITTTGDQMIVPMPTIVQQAAEQRQRWPHWVTNNSEASAEAVFGRTEELTWAHLDHIVCPSQYVASELSKLGYDNTSVHPYPFECPPLKPKGLSRGRLTVGFLGAVGLRKGAPYFLEVARRLSSRMDFVMVGPVLVSNKVSAELSKHVRVVGSVPRTEAMTWLDRFDVLLFPTTCEGCAGAVQEALAHGVPVLTSPNAGSVVRHRTEGYLLPYDAVGDYAAALEELDDDRALLERFSIAARTRAEEFSIDSYGQALCQSLNAVLTGKHGHTP